MREKVIAGVISLLLFLFAAVQFNDPDGWKWVIAYGLPAILFALLLFNIQSIKVARVFMITYACVALLYVPDFLSWMTDGFPSIVETMKADRPYVEFVREFFGLVIIMAALIYYIKQERE